MRTTVTNDDALFERARQVSDPGIDKAELIREAVKTYVRVKSAKRLATLGAEAPQIPDIPRRKAEAAQT